MPLVVRPQPQNLDLGNFAQSHIANSPVAGSTLKQAFLETATSPSTATPSSGARSRQSCNSGTPSQMLPMPLSRDIALSSGQYPPGVGWTPVAQKRTNVLVNPTSSVGSVLVNPTSSVGSTLGGALAGFGSPRSSIAAATGLALPNPTSSIGSAGFGSPRSSIAGATGMPMLNPTSSMGSSMGHRSSLAQQPSVVIVTPKAATGDRAFPPGLGYTPLAAASLPLASKSRFGMDSPELSRANSGASSVQLSRADSKESTSKEPTDILQRTTSKESVVPADHLKRTISQMADDGSIAKELMLIFRDEEAAAALSPEAAGFVWPQPGWLRACRTAEEIPTNASQTKPAKALEKQSAQKQKQTTTAQKQKAVSQQTQQQQQGSTKPAQAAAAVQHNAQQQMPKQQRKQQQAAPAMNSIGTQQLQGHLSHGSTKHATTQPQRYQQQIQGQSWQEDWSWQGGSDSWQWSQPQMAQQVSWSTNGKHGKNTLARKGSGKGK